MSTSRERVQATLHHRLPDRVPLDVGGTVLTSMHVKTVYALRQFLHLDAPGTPVKVVEPYQMLGEIADDLVEALEVDVLPLRAPQTLFGFPLEGWKPWRLADGTPVLVPDGFNTVPDANGEILLYPDGDTSAPASGRMPAGGYYFDAIIRQDPLGEGEPDPSGNTEEFTPITRKDLDYYAREAARLTRTGGRAIAGGFCFTSFGDVGTLPAQWLRHPRGVRDIEEWYVSTHVRRNFVKAVFERQCEIGIANLAALHNVLGDRVDVTVVTAADFGTQTGLFLSRDSFRDLYFPFHQRVNEWIHAHTSWKTFIHSCGAVFDLVPDFIEAGFDILNPVQVNAAGMDRAALKREYGADVVFWGGGIDTQRVLPFGTPEQVKADVCESIRTLGRGGGFVFAPVHNIQASIPVANLVALFESFAAHRENF